MINGTAATGSSLIQIGGSCSTATMQSVRLAAVQRTASRGVTAPVTIGRRLKRGCTLSYSRSTILSMANAALRAPVMASVIQNSTENFGAPPAAKNAPI